MKKQNSTNNGFSHWGDPLSRKLGAISTIRLALILTRFRFVRQFAETKLGVIWLLLDSFFQALTYGVLFSFITSPEVRPGENYAISIIVGVISIRLITDSLVAGVGAITEARNLRRWTPANLAVTLLSRYFEIAAHWIIGILIAITGSLFLGVQPHFNWALLPFYVVLFAPISLGLIMVFGALNWVLPDFTKITGVLSRLLFFGSGVFFSVEQALSEHPILLAVAKLNPGFIAIEIAREVVFGRAISISLVASTQAAGLVLLLIGIFTIRAATKIGRPDER